MQGSEVRFEGVLALHAPDGTQLHVGVYPLRGSFLRRRGSQRGADEFWLGG